MTSPRIARLASRHDFHGAVRSALAAAAQNGAREIRLVDADFAEWPLGEKAIVESLSAWAAANRKLVIVAADFEPFARTHTRFALWRRTWSHLVECRSDPDLQAEQLPCLLHVPGLVSVRVLDRATWRGTVSNHPADDVQCREVVDALLQRSVEAFPATTLGL